jgi:hypothetical protein
LHFLSTPLLKCALEDALKSDGAFLGANCFLSIGGATN